MAALAYVLLPLSGAVAYFAGGSARVRFHGLQAIAFGLLWPALLFLCSRVSRPLTQLGFLLGGALWIALVAGAAVGRDPSLPGLGSLLRRAARTPPGGGSAAPDKQKGGG